MFVSRFFNLRSLALLVLGLILAGSAYAFAAANVVPESGAGDGNNTISGYTVTAVSYTLNSTNPANLDSVAFDIVATAGASAPTTVKAQLVSGGSWFSCTQGSGNRWSCSVTGVTALAADNLRVVAAQ